MKARLSNFLSFQIAMLGVALVTIGSTRPAKAGTYNVTAATFNYTETSVPGDQGSVTATGNPLGVISNVNTYQYPHQNPRTDSLVQDAYYLLNGGLTYDYEWVPDTNEPPADGETNYAEGIVAEATTTDDGGSFVGAGVSMSGALGDYFVAIRDDGDGYGDMHQTLEDGVAYSSPFSGAYNFSRGVYMDYGTYAACEIAGATTHITAEAIGSGGKAVTVTF